MSQSGYTPIQLYGSTTAGNTPAAGDLATDSSGVELAVNAADGKLFYKDDGGTVRVLASKDATAGTFSNVTITGGTINGTSVGASSASTGAFTSVTASADSAFTSTGALAISKGTTAQQPGSPTTGMMRYNTSTNQFEGYSGSSPAWKSIGGSALSNDTSTSSNLYPVFAGATSGTAENLYTSNANYLFKPSTGELQALELVASNGIVVNSATVSADYTIATGNNAMSAGPVAVGSGITVTVSSGSVWTVI